MSIDQQADAKPLETLLFGYKENFSTWLRHTVDIT